jgi:hypothetical protein
MFTTLFGWIKSLFSEPTYQDSLDTFVSSKHPTTTSEVEYWIQYYDQRKSHGLGL